MPLINEYRAIRPWADLGALKSLDSFLCKSPTLKSDIRLAATRLSPALTSAGMKIEEMTYPSMQKHACIVMICATDTWAFNHGYINVPAMAPIFAQAQLSPWNVLRTWGGYTCVGNTYVAILGPKFSEKSTKQRRQNFIVLPCFISLFGSMYSEAANAENANALNRNP